MNSFLATDINCDSELLQLIIFHYVWLTTNLKSNNLHEIIHKGPIHCLILPLRVSVWHSLKFITKMNKIYIMENHFAFAKNYLCHINSSFFIRSQLVKLIALGSIGRKTGWYRCFLSCFTTLPLEERLRNVLYLKLCRS